MWSRTSATLSRFATPARNLSLARTVMQEVTAAPAAAATAAPVEVVSNVSSASLAAAAAAAAAPRARKVPQILGAEQLSKRLQRLACDVDANRKPKQNPRTGFWNSPKVC